MSRRVRRKENPYRSPVMAGYYAVTPRGHCIVCADPLPAVGRSRAVHPGCYPEYQRMYGTARRQAARDPLAPIAKRLRALEVLAARAVERACRRLERAR